MEEWKRGGWVSWCIDILGIGILVDWEISEVGIGEMCSASAEEISQDLEALEALVVDNSDLERLEALLDEFSIFEAIGAVRVELHHSDFLAFLLNPTQNHGLGDAFAKRLLQKSLATKWHTIFLRNFLTPKSYRETTMEELEEEVSQSVLDRIHLQRNFGRMVRKE